MRAQGRSGEVIANMCPVIDEERDGYAGAFSVEADDGGREFYLRPDGPGRIHAEYLLNRDTNDGTLDQASFDLSTGTATMYYDFEDSYRSEERRVGKECKCRGAPERRTKNEKDKQHQTYE